MKKYFNILNVSFLFCLLLSPRLFAGNLNLPADSNGGTICSVTKNSDDQTILGSIRRALNQGYNIQSAGLPNLCTQKISIDTSGIIILNEPIVLNRSTANGFTLEKGNVSGEVVFDASSLPEGSCAIVIDAAHVTLRNIKIQNAKGSGICLERNARLALIDHVAVTQSGNGVWVKSGARGNTIQFSSLYDNTAFGVNLSEADQNTATQNALYRNNLGPLFSPLTTVSPQLISGTPNNNTATEFTISGTVGAVVDKIEFFRKIPNGSTTNYIKTLNSGDLQGLNFITSITANSGDEIFAISLTSDGSTSAVSNNLSLNPSGAVTTGARNCFIGQVFPPQIDFDHDGIPDYLEDKNKNCIVDVGETDPTKADTDNDGLSDGMEDSNHNGVVDRDTDNNFLESDPTRTDTDGDGIPDGIEDKNHNGVFEAGEYNPRSPDTDNDTIPDNIEDANHNGIVDRDSNSNLTEMDGTLPYGLDGDRDGLTDAQEDINRNGVVDLYETDPRKADSDGDSLLDGSDPCPKEASLLCQHPCVVGAIAAADLDTDNDGIPDRNEDFNHNCILDANETNPYLLDTDGDTLVDSSDSCPRNPDRTCANTCVPGGYVPPTRDSDHDGFYDVQEDLNGNCIVDPGESNAFLADTDHDGIPDNTDHCVQDPNPLCSHQCISGETPPADLDSDGDGITDIYEDLNHNCIQDGHESDYRQRDSDHDGLYDNQDPCALNPDLACASSCIPGEFVPPIKDSDRDGVPDVLEDKNNNCLKDITESDAFSTDTDGDGVPDGSEDRNHSGGVDAGETNPILPDSDGDGISDGAEDKNHNGVVDFGELNPSSTDTDGDGIPDRIEDANLNGVWDKGETSAYLADTDQDGIKDGDEDKSHNGRVDAGETDPRNPDSDGDGASDGQELSQGTNPIHGSSSDFNQAAGNGGCVLNKGLSPSAFTSLWMLLFSFSLPLFYRRKHEK